MEINNNLASQVGRNAIYDNGQAHVRETAPGTGPKMSMPSAIYHGPADPDVGYDGPKNYTIKVESFIRESSEELSARSYEMTDLLIFELGDTSIDLKHATDAATKVLSSELQKKDWGFSVSNGELRIQENNDKISDSEREAIQSAFSNTASNIFPTLLPIP